MSKPIFQDLFAFRGRRDQRSYLLLQLATLVPVAMVVVFASVLGRQEDGRWIATGLFVLGGFVVLWCGLAVLSQRCRDLGYSGWTSLVLLVPVIGQLFALAVCFMPGNFGDNRYGPDPLMAGGGEAPSGAPGA